MSECMIGILAGMGPRSTAPFTDLIVDECQLQYCANYDEDYPKMMIYSLPTPFYIDRPIDHELMKKTIMEGLQKLESIGVTYIAMPCNTAHIYFNELKDSIHIPLLNIVDATIQKLPPVSQTVTVFSTNWTFQSNIYQRGIINAGHKFIFKEEWQIKINSLIKNIKVNKDDPQNPDIWNELMEDVKRESIENIVVACTDLNAVLNKVPSAITIIDSAKCLAETIVKKYIDLVNSAV